MQQNLDEILEKTIETLDSSKKEIFSISESSRKEMEKIKEKISEVNNDIEKVISEINELEKENRKARLKLMEVSKKFDEYSEAEVKEVYERAEDTSVEIAVLQEKEEQLKNRRSDLEDRLLSVKNTFEKAENLVSKVSVVKKYLYGELSDLSEQFDDLQQKQDLAFKVIEAQEEERKRVAREIHDGPAQSIANLVFRVELAQKMMDKDKEKAKEELKTLKDMVRYSVKDVRKIIYDLRPMSLDDLGLIPTIRRYIEKFEEQTNLEVELKVLGNSKNIPKTHEITIFRIIQEALNNVHKHAEASQCDLKIEFTNNNINVLVVDNGLGFEIDEVDEGKYGLINMRERCELINAKMNISSDKSGTRISIRAPLKQEQE
ncbi:MAG: sensor histidine kinase [Bacillota bacterium]